jgi:hypothetical protein
MLDLSIAMETKRKHGNEEARKYQQIQGTRQTSSDLPGSKHGIGGPPDGACQSICLSYRQLNRRMIRSRNLNANVDVPNPQESFRQDVEALVRHQGERQDHS